MIRIDDNDEQPNGLDLSIIYHPQSLALEKRIKEIVDDQFAMFGLSVRSAHRFQTRQDFIDDMMATSKKTKADITSTIIKGLVWGVCLAVGALITLGAAAILQGTIK